MIEHRQYQTLNRSSQLHFNAQGTSLSVRDADRNELKRFKCHSVEEDNAKNKTKLIVQVNFEWYVDLKANNISSLDTLHYRAVLLFLRQNSTCDWTVAHEIYPKVNSNLKGFQISTDFFLKYLLLLLPFSGIIFASYIVKL